LGCHILPDSAGHESWNVSCGNQQFIAVGGGELAIFGGVIDNSEHGSHGGSFTGSDAQTL
jgi:hypothetical protein